MSLNQKREVLKFNRRVYKTIREFIGGKLYMRDISKNKKIIIGIGIILLLIIIKNNSIITRGKLASIKL